MEHTVSGGPDGRRVGGTLPAGTALVALLLGLAGIAWLVSARLATPDMRLGVLTQASMGSAGGQMGMSGAMSMSLSVFLVAWTVMMVAMMLPSLLPAVRAFDGLARAARQSPGVPVLFVAGYLLLWSALGAVAYLAVQALQGGLAAGSVTALRVGAALLAAAGVYELIPLKQACLRHCRSPHTSVALPADRQRSGYPGAVRAGLRQGVYCLGSSGPLMLLLLLVGMMNLVWMGVIAGVILIEKGMPGGFVVSKVLGWGLAGLGLVLLAAPHTVPALGGG